MSNYISEQIREEESRRENFLKERQSRELNNMYRPSPSHIPMVPPSEPHTLCKDCNTKIYDNYYFCPNCGKEIRQVCKACGTKLKQADNFCHTCGKKREIKASKEIT